MEVVFASEELVRNQVRESSTPMGGALNGDHAFDLG